MSAFACSLSVLLVQSHFGEPQQGHSHADGVVAVRERDLDASHFAGARGLITTTHLDQIGFIAHRQSLKDFLDRGGRWFFNGHLLRPLVDGLANYVPLERPRRDDYRLTRLFEHPIFAGIEQSKLEENRGVAGFYGRGYNPPPEGAVAVNGIGPELWPIDWDWARPRGGRIFCHAGNDLGGSMGRDGVGALLPPRIVAWCRGDLP